MNQQGCGVGEVQRAAGVLGTGALGALLKLCMHAVAVPP